MTGGDALRAASARLTAAGIAGAAGDARILLAHALGLPRGRLTLVLGDPVPAQSVERFRALIDRRAARVPVSHLVGERLFFGRRFRVTPDVLDPRPETEELVAEALRAPLTRVLDLGTGSGAILLTLLAERPQAEGLGTDISPAALAVAQANACDLDLNRRAAFATSDWFAAVQGKFDLVVSNPPYIASAEMPHLAPELQHEPRIALTDEADGLGAYRHIAAGACAHLQPGGRLVVEIGPTQGDTVAAILVASGLEKIRRLQDIDGRDRVICASNTG